MYECDKCGDVGYVAVVYETGEEVSFHNEPRGVKTYAKECVCQAEKRKQRLFKSSRITSNFLKVGFKGFVIKGRPECVKDALAVAVEYYKQFNDIRHREQNSCALLGPPGCGKTHLLMAVCNGLLAQGIGVHYFPWVEGFGELKDNLDELESRLEIMRQVDVLFLDDLFKGRREPTDFQNEQLFGVVNYRYLNCKPMLVSSELYIDDICKIDEGIGRRIWERAKGHRVIMGLTDAERAQGMRLNYSLID